MSRNDEELLKLGLVFLFLFALCLMGGYLYRKAYNDCMDEHHDKYVCTTYANSFLH